MSRRALHIDPDGRWGRALAAIVAPRRPPPPRFVLTCIGCGCTDDRACPGSCWWTRPGLCSSCSVAPAADVLKPTRRVEQMFMDAAVAALKTMRRTFRVSSVLVIAFHGGEDLLAEDEREIADGKVLDATTTVRIGKGGEIWTSSLVWRRRDEHGVNHRTTQRLSFRMGKPRRGGRRPR